MKRIYPTEPYYPISNKDYSHLAHYLECPTIRDIALSTSMGFHTGCNAVCLAPTKTQLLQHLTDLVTYPRNYITMKYKIPAPTYGSSWSLDAVMEELKSRPIVTLLDHIHKVHHAPLQTEYTLYLQPSSFLSVPQYTILRHLLAIPNNPAITFSKYTQRTQIAHSPFITTNLPLHSSIALGTGVGAYVFPLYLDNTMMGSHSRRPNISPVFMKALEGKYSTTITPSQAFYYIYSILWHKQYRTKYCVFLRLDFPRIPLVASLDTFLSLAALGEQLATLHLQAPNIPYPEPTTTP